jgi:hypothetical protein
MRWMLTNRADPRAAKIADRHYNRQKPGTRQFTPPGRVIVLVTPEYDALWCTSAPYAQYVRHAWAGAWVCSLFRNESGHLSSDLIREAVAITRGIWPDVPPLGMVTFVDRSKTRPKRDPGYCYRMAGWRACGMTKGGLYALQQLPGEMPAPLRIADRQPSLWEVA